MSNTIPSLRSKFIFKVEMPKPSIKLKRGAAMHPERAIWGKRLIKALLATRSPIEFPQASRVIPKSEGFIPIIMPSNIRISINTLAISQIHQILIQKPYKSIKV